MKRLAYRMFVNKINIILVLIFTCINVSYQEKKFEEQSLVTYTACRVDSDCHTRSNNSFCFENDQDKVGKCKCTEGYELVSRNRTFFACLGPAGYGEQCEKNVQCQLTLSENAECSNEACRCKENSHQYTDGKCYVSVVLGEVCRNDANCWLSDGTFGNCVRGRCACKFDRQIPASDRTSCVDGRRLGESCDNDAQCALVPSAVCRVACTCAAGYSLSRDQQRCLNAATAFGDFCEEDDQCSTHLQGSICAEGVCACAAGQHGVGSRCTRTALLRHACDSDEECAPNATYTGVVACSDGSCRCLPGVVNETMGCNDSFRVRSSVLVLISGFLVKILR